MSYAAPSRPPRRPDASGNRAQEISIRIPLDRHHIIADLQVEQSAYEQAKMNLSQLEEDKLALTEQIESETTLITETIDAQQHPSIAARDRAVKVGLAGSGVIRSNNDKVREINGLMVRAKEDVSVFRHRMLSLRAALAPDPEAALALNDEAGDR